MYKVAAGDTVFIGNPLFNHPTYFTVNIENKKVNHFMIVINITQILFVKYHSAWRLDQALLCVIKLSSKLPNPIKEGSTMNITSRQKQTHLSQGIFDLAVFYWLGDDI